MGCLSSSSSSNKLSALPSNEHLALDKRPAGRTAKLFVLLASTQIWPFRTIFYLLVGGRWSALGGRRPAPSEWHVRELELQNGRPSFLAAVELAGDFSFSQRQTSDLTNRPTDRPTTILIWAEICSIVAVVSKNKKKLRSFLPTRRALTSVRPAPLLDPAASAMLPDLELQVSRAASAANFEWSRVGSGWVGFCCCCCCCSIIQQARADSEQFSFGPLIKRLFFAPAQAATIRRPSVRPAAKTT